ncbi:ClpP/crotonase [Saitoella complicata NRRL Y-17804]|uniref:ClpP/crotonase n=1 Tax=Saitoella complicata (strain BCRC 22490 / CBS 7301 / JCM 7358 / NBRC 10748 / NRRL Y-17804) TaxID=698492 RepID=UPI0008677810|nr:ClpP/crotonase [Saitoella complicata NRRL Y-17804]ODQ50342.1 ClpP/crotonase [Saitoella complicata NRRL Y-17804]
MTTPLIETPLLTLAPSTINPAILHLTLHSPPVNSLTAPLWRAILDALTLAESTSSAHALIISSALTKPVFSAGNDLRELYAPMTTEARYTEYWVLQNECLARLYGTRLFVVAAVGGACPAGGCAIAMCADRRIATRDLSIGLNEAMLGIAVPGFWHKLMETLVGRRTAERVCTMGTFMNGDEALASGLVDELVASRPLLLTRAEELCTAAVAVPATGRAGTKQSFRGGVACEWGRRERILAEAKGNWRELEKGELQGALGGVMKKLGLIGKKSKI